MEKQILSTEPIAERLAILEANSEKKEKFTYSRELDIAEVQELQSELSQIMITVDQHDQQLKMAKEIYKAAVKPSKEKCVRFCKTFVVKSRKLQKRCI